MYRYKRSVPVSYDRQGYIYFLCKGYDDWCSEEERKRIRVHAKRSGGPYCRALMEFLTTDAGAVAVCEKHHISQSTLERAVRRFYTEFWDDPVF